jgi:hypothetical protein
MFTAVLILGMVPDQGIPHSERSGLAGIRGDGASLLDRQIAICRFADFPVSQLLRRGSGFDPDY